MTADEILDVVPGRDLDAAVGVALGWRWVAEDAPEGSIPYPGRRRYITPPGWTFADRYTPLGVERGRVAWADGTEPVYRDWDGVVAWHPDYPVLPDYSTDVDRVGTLLVWLRGRCGDVSMRGGPDGWRCESGMVGTSAPTPELAVCRVVLLVGGQEVKS